MHLVRIDTGGGKSDAARIRGPVPGNPSRARRQAHLAMAVPTHSLSVEQALRFEALPEVKAAGLRCRVWRGRRAENPDDPGHTMCRNLDLVREVQALKLDVHKRACAICPHRDGCAYLAQNQQCAELWLVAHQMLFEAKPRAIGDLVAVMIDENPLQAALEGIERAITLPLATLARIDRIEGSGGSLATDRLLYLRGLALQVLHELPDGPLPKDPFITAGLIPNSAQEARRLEWQTHVDVELSPDMTPEARREALRAAGRNADLGRRVMFWTAIGALLDPGGPSQSGWASIATEDDENGTPVRFLILKGRRDVGRRWQAPTLHLDATGRSELLRYIWPSVKQSAYVRLQAPYQRIVQTGDQAFALSRLDVEGVVSRCDGSKLAEALRLLPAGASEHGAVARWKSAQWTS